jgi:hypothetical protein
MKIQRRKGKNLLASSTFPVKVHIMKTCARIHTHVYPTGKICLKGRKSKENSANQQHYLGKNSQNIFKNSKLLMELV